MLPFLHIAERDGWHHFVTGDESWFFFNISPRRMWTLSRDDVVTKSRHDIQSKQLMFTIIWNPSGFYVISRLPNYSKMNSVYFVTNIFIPIEQAIFPGGKAPHERRRVVHFDSYSVHTSRISTEWFEEHSILRMPHPPHSPELAPSDFYCFCYSQRKTRTDSAA
jgi:histone-lysine N-methyltransferase SETMAR